MIKETDAEIFRNNLKEQVLEKQKIMQEKKSTLDAQRLVLWPLKHKHKQTQTNTNTQTQTQITNTQ